MPDDSQIVDWEGVVAREGPAVWRTVRRLVGNDADAEDVFQDTFVAAVELSRREPVRQVRAVLLRLAHARAVDKLRVRYRRAAREQLVGRDDEGVDDGALGVAESPDPLPHERAEAAELSQRLREALAQLPEKQAETFCLFCLEGWTYQEISDRTGASIDLVGVNVYRARAKLRKLLAKAFEGTGRERV